MQRMLLGIVLIPLLSGVSLRAGEDSLLGRLEHETRALAVAAERAVVTVSFGPAPGTSHRGRYVRAKRGGDLDVLFKRDNGLVFWAARGGTTSGVLAGTPPKVVVPYAAVGKAGEVEVTLHDGRKVKAQRAGGDPELGVAVFSLPGDVARELDGLVVEREWSRLRAGSLAVAAGAPGRGVLGLALLRGADKRLGWVSAGGEAAGAALLGTRGTLLALRAGSAGRSSCASCHTGSATAPGGASYTLSILPSVRVPLVPGSDGPAGGPASGWRRPGEAAPLVATSMPITFARAAPRISHGEFIAGPVIRRVLDDLERHGRIRHSYLGVVLGDTVGKGSEAGVMITAVLDGSPAQAAGLQAGQRIAAIDGLSCPSTATLSRVLVLHRPGEEVTLKLAPDGKEVEVTLGDRAEAQRRFVTPETVGLQCVEIGPALRAFLELEDGVTGVAVQQVRPASPAHRAGLRRGDVITWAGGGAIADLAELNAALAGAKGSLALRGLRGGEPLSVTLAVKGMKASPR